MKKRTGITFSLETEPRTTPAYPTRFLGLFLCLCLCFTALAACVSTQTEQPNDPNLITLPSDTVIPVSYSEVFKAIEALSHNQRNAYAGAGDSGLAMEDSAANEATPLAADEAVATDAVSSGSGHSETNVQVEGIDEGDIVKTDGKHIYMIAGSELVVLQPNGADTAEIARINLDGKTIHKDVLDDNPVYPRELYVSKNTLAVLYQYSRSEDTDSSDESSNDDSSASAYREPLYPAYKTVSEVALFNIEDASNPRYLNSFGQDGYYSSSRVQDGTLYLISNHAIYDYSALEEDAPETYIPGCYTGDESTLIDAKDICILPLQNSLSYTIISSIDLNACSRIDQQSILGASGTVYMSLGNLYLADYSNQEVVRDSHPEGSFTVTEYQNVSSTRIAKFSLTQGVLEFVADTTVQGSLLNQFSMDEYDGKLRLVTTVDSYRYRRIEDEKGAVDDYQSYDSEPSVNALFVLDEQLNEIGSIDGLAKDERVYSVRFTGEVGYFVTFKQVDPLFAVDLSDPANPVVKSELKIPGFSTYMHPYSEGLLFGLGMAADEDGRTLGLKMSMFDTTDPYNITEKQVLTLEEYSSVALYDHKAIFIDQEHNIIGFQSGESYSIYGYSADEGFFLRKKFDPVSDTDDSKYYSFYHYNDRGLYVDSYFYLCGTHHIGVYELDTLEEVLQLPIEVKDSEYSGIEPLITPMVE